MALAQRDLVRPAANPVMLDVARLLVTPLQTQPYEYLVVEDFIRTEYCQKLIDAYPQVEQPGSFPLPTVTCSAQFLELIGEMESAQFRTAIEQKFHVDLAGKPTMYTVRGRCREKDGQVHTDSESKIITVLLYMNPGHWDNTGGRLRVLNSKDVNDIAAEISPKVGTLLVFRRSNSSWHGHLPFEGERKVIQMNWVVHEKYVDREQSRHKLSATIKSFFGKRDANDY